MYNTIFPMPCHKEYCVENNEFFAVFLFVLVKMIKTTVLWWNFEFTGGKTAFSRASRLSDGRFDERAAHTRPERCACNHESGQLCSAASAVYAR